MAVDVASSTVPCAKCDLVGGAGSEEGRGVAHCMLVDSDVL